MVNPEDIAERFWSLAQKPSEEARREQLFLDEVIRKAHCEREIGARLEDAEAAKSAHGTVVESFGKVCLYTIAEENWRDVRFTDEEIRSDPALFVTRLRGPRTP